MTKKFKVAVLGLGMGEAWAKAAYDLPNTELALVYDPAFGVYDRVQTQYYLERNIPLAKSEEEVYASDVDIIIVATPDHLHAEQSVRALMAGKHVACEKPLAPTVEECKKIARAVKESGKYFMTGQVCRYAPGFQTAKCCWMPEESGNWLPWKANMPTIIPSAPAGKTGVAAKRSGVRDSSAAAAMRWTCSAGWLAIPKKSLPT